MVTRPIVLAVLCVGLFLILQSLLPKTMAFNSNIDRFMMEDRRTQRRKNYMVQKERNNDFLANLEGVITYENEPVDPDRSPDELSAFIVDYANMIRDDVILLDKSVETRTRKRGNIQVTKYNNNNQVIPDPPCPCKSNQDLRDLGDNVYPQYVPIRNCSLSQKEPSCVPPYKCIENTYDIHILRKYPKISLNEDGSNVFPRNLRLCETRESQWLKDKVTISVGCVCVGEWMENTG